MTPRDSCQGHYKIGGGANPVQVTEETPSGLATPDSTAAPTQGVVWDIPKAGGGYISEVVCWHDGCQWRWTSDRREEVDREMQRHLLEAHGG